MSDSRRRHIPLEKWLCVIGFPEYLPLFSEHFTGVESLLYKTESDIRDLGVINGAHRARLISSLVILRDKYERGSHPSSVVRRHPSSAVRRSSSSSQLSSSRLSFSGPPPSPSGRHSMASEPTYPYDREYHRSNRTPEQIRQDLEDELRLPSSDMRSHAWFHGSIPRQKAEKLTQKRGDFLVRESTSQPGDYVLTCNHGNHGGVALHFVINKRLPNNVKDAQVRYHFEGDLFDSVPDLIRYYIGGAHPISNASGATIRSPVNRTLPLNYYDSKYSAVRGGLQRAFSNAYLAVNEIEASERSKEVNLPNFNPERLHRRAGSQPLLDVVLNNTALPRSPVERHSSMPFIDSAGLTNKVTVSDLVTNQSEINVYRTGSEPMLTPIGEKPRMDAVTSPTLQSIPTGSETDVSRPPPPKPSRIPSVKYRKKPKVVIRNIDLYTDDDRDYSDYSTVKSDPSFLKKPQSVKYSFPAKANKKGKPKRSLVIKESKSEKIGAAEKEEVCEPNETAGVTLRPDSDQENNNSVKVSAAGDYDNNFRQVTVTSPSEGRLSSNSKLDDYDVPRNNTPMESSSSESDSQQIEEMTPEPTQNVNKLKIRLGSETRFSILDTSDYGLVDDNVPTRDSDSRLIPAPEPTLLLPESECRPNYDPTAYTPLFLPPENKPLDPVAMVTVRDVLSRHTAATLATHTTKLDLELLRLTTGALCGLGVSSGLELITLPQGSQLRTDVLERYRCLVNFVALTILTGIDVDERAAALHRWIDVAQELKGTMGNLFGFSAIMTALALPQVTRLHGTWLTLRTSRTKSAFLYESKLKSFMKALDEGSAVLPLQDVCIPHIAPIAQLLHRGPADVLDLTPWEATDVDLGLDIMLVHLDTARLITAQSALYRAKGNSVISDHATDACIEEVFSTQFHLRFMWGRRGAAVEAKERSNKFKQILLALSLRAEPPLDTAL